MRNVSEPAQWSVEGWMVKQQPANEVPCAAHISEQSTLEVEGNSWIAENRVDSRDKPCDCIAPGWLISLSTFSQ